jgi:hypothetical protein
VLKNSEVPDWCACKNCLYVQNGPAFVYEDDYGISRIRKCPEELNDVNIFEWKQQNCRFKP